jgi:hypothetical protein
MTIKWIGKDGKELASGHVIEDGQRIKVSMNMMDSAPPNIEALTRAAMSDASMPSAAMHRPGSVALSDADRAARELALSKRDSRLTSAWRNLPPLQGTVADATQRTTPADVTTVNTARARKMARQAEAWKMGAK